MYNNPMMFTPYINQVNTIQHIQKPEASVRCFFVSCKEDLDQLKPEWNTVYIGINKQTNEIYTRQLRNDGLIDSLVYKQSLLESKSEQTESQSILEKLTQIEHRLEQMNVNNKRPDTEIRDGTAEQLTANATSQSNAVGQVSAGTDTNPAQLC